MFIGNIVSPRTHLQVLCQMKGYLKFFFFYGITIWIIWIEWNDRVFNHEPKTILCEHVSSLYMSLQLWLRRSILNSRQHVSLSMWTNYNGKPTKPSFSFIMYGKTTCAKVLQHIKICPVVKHYFLCNFSQAWGTHVIFVHKTHGCLVEGGNEVSVGFTWALA